MLKVVFLGEFWLGSSARACSAALRRQGVEVTDVDAQTVMPAWRSAKLRAMRRLARPLMVAELNMLLERTVSEVNPDYLFAFKGTFITPSTLRKLKAGGVKLINYFPDNSIFAHGREIVESLSEYDLVFAAHYHTLGQIRGRVRGATAFHVPHGYDAELHKPLDAERTLREGPAPDITFIGTYTPQKERILDELLKRMRLADLWIRGDQWAERCKSSTVRQKIKGMAIPGHRYVEAISRSKIVLGLTSEAAFGAVEGDSVTTRSFEIPACRGFMLHQRNDEILKYYREGVEMECFGDAEELCSKISYYLQHADERDRIRVNGHSRCVPEYSYDARMRDLLSLLP